MAVYTGRLYVTVLCKYVYPHNVSKTIEATVTRFGTHDDHKVSSYGTDLGYKWSKVKVMHADSSKANAYQFLYSVTAPRFIDGRWMAQPYPVNQAPFLLDYRYLLGY